jgi:hypothetical protein
MGSPRTFELGELDAWVRMTEASMAHGREPRPGCAPVGAVLPGVLAGIPGMLYFLRTERRTALEALLLEQQTSWCLSRWLAWYRDEAGPLRESERDWVFTSVTQALTTNQARREARRWYRRVRGTIPPRSRGSGFLDVLRSALDSMDPGLNRREVQGLLFA